VCVLARDMGSRTLKFLAFATVDVAGPAGALDALVGGPGRVDVAGWLLDPRSPGAQASGRVLVDGAEAARFTTTVPRPDVSLAVPGSNPTCGFQVRASGIASGPHQVCVELVHPSGRTAQLACRDVVVA
jgi:hypothetical protein